MNCGLSSAIINQLLLISSGASSPIIIGLAFLKPSIPTIFTG